MKDLLDSEKEAIANNMDAKWKKIRPPYFGARNSKRPGKRPAIVLNGVQYGDELPQRLKENGVSIRNEKSDVQ